ncbi:MAG: glutamate synthase subunit beta [bacterium]|nr:glutamate synthase subunit beta [bacterium]
MGKPTGFLEVKRLDRSYAPIKERIGHYSEFLQDLGDSDTVKQASRCMDCGIPFCHTGCPVNNQIPDWNDLVYRNDWQEACVNLHSTNNFPEFTGRICPAPCEESCTLNINDSPVTIRTIECAIVDKGFDEGWIKPQIAQDKSGKKVAIIGAGPTGLAAAQQLARAGHEVHLFEKNKKPGGLMRYGIPDFKLDKHIVDRRADQMSAEGVTFHYGSHIGVDVKFAQLQEDHDAVLLTCGSEMPRDLPVEGRELNGVYYAMEFLTQQNRRNGDEPIGPVDPILATDKHVLVIGGGDTGSDCIGTSIRQKAAKVTQLEIMPRPPEHPDKGLTWPDWPNRLRTSSSQQEGVTRDFSVMTTKINGEDGRVTSISCVRVDDKFQPVEGSEFEFKADLVLLAMGFVHPIHEGMLEELGLEKDERGNVSANEMDYATSVEGVYAAGDMRRGQSLVVWAIREGRQAAHAIDKYLMGKTLLPR